MHKSVAELRHDQFMFHNHLMIVLYLKALTIVVSSKLITNHSQPTYPNKRYLQRKLSFLSSKDLNRETAGYNTSIQRKQDNNLPTQAT